MKFALGNIHVLGNILGYLGNIPPNLPFYFGTHTCTISLMHTSIRELVFISNLIMSFIWCLYWFEDDHMSKWAHLIMITYLFSWFKQDHWYLHACIR